MLLCVNVIKVAMLKINVISNRVLVELNFCLGSLVQAMGTIFKSPKPGTRYMAEEVPKPLLSNNRILIKVDKHFECCTCVE